MYPEPVRYELDRSQVSALLRLSDIDTNGVLLGPVQAVDDPLGVARSAGLVDEAGTVPPVLVDALGVAASPARVVTLTINVPGVDEWMTMHIGGGPAGGPYVVISGGDSGIDLLVLSTEIEVAALFDELLDLTTYPTQPVAPDLGIDLRAWLGLLAAADARRAAGLVAQLDRESAPTVTLDAPLLDAQLKQGLNATDTRWAVTGFVPVAPVDVRRAGIDGTQAMAGLVASGLVDEAGSLTELGVSLTELIGLSLKVAGATLVLTGNEGAVRAGEVLVLRAPLRLGVGFWREENGAYELVFTEPTGEAAVEMLRRLLLIESHAAADAVAPTGGTRCPRCGAAVTAADRFCAQCGGRVSTGEEAPT